MLPPFQAQPVVSGAALLSHLELTLGGVQKETSPPSLHPIAGGKNSGRGPPVSDT